MDYRERVSNHFITHLLHLKVVWWLCVTFDFQPSVSRFTTYKQVYVYTVEVVFSDKSIIQCKDQRVQYVRHVWRKSPRGLCHPAHEVSIPCRSRCGGSWACFALAGCTSLKGIWISSRRTTRVYQRSDWFVSWMSALASQAVLALETSFSCTNLILYDLSYTWCNCLNTLTIILR